VRKSIFWKSENRFSGRAEEKINFLFSSRQLLEILDFFEHFIMFESSLLRGILMEITILFIFVFYHSIVSFF